MSGGTRYLLTSEPASLRGLRVWLGQQLCAAGLDPLVISALTLAVDEACTNVIRHAYDGEPGHPIRITLEAGPKRIRCVVRDYGRPCDPSTLPTAPHGQLRAGGYGVQIIRQVFSQVEYRPCTTGTELVLTFQRRIPETESHEACNNGKNGL